MNFKYQIIIVGEPSVFESKVLGAFYKHVDDLGLNKDCFVEIRNTNFDAIYKANLPTFCLYFGSQTGNFLDLDITDRLITDATLILPIASDLDNVAIEIPLRLRSINVFQLNAENDIERLVSCLLEGLSLLRLTRRLFISYKRNESSVVAIQLFEKLEKNGFDVFLDTHSVRPGTQFQDELWHRMADTDVVVLLNTPGFLNSEWTTQELARANAMSIGIIQLIWPTHNLERDAKLSIPYQLTDANFGNKDYSNSKSYLTDQTLLDIVSQVESLRARSLGSRQDNIITEFISSSIKLGKKSDLQPEKFITVKRKDGKESILIPTVGVPQAFTYNQSEELVSRIKLKNVEGVYLLFDHRNIREKWLEHLAWLDNYLPIKTLKIIDVEQWLSKI